MRPLAHSPTPSLASRLLASRLLASRLLPASLLLASTFALFACGQPPPAEPEPEPTAGDEQPEPEPEPEPPPPPPAARLRVIHASPEALLTSGSVTADETSLAEGLEYRAASEYVEIEPGTAPTIAVLGVPSAETGRAAQLTQLELASLEPDATHTLIVHGALGTEPALSVVPLRDASGTPDDEHGAIRFFAGMIETPALDLCQPGATRRAPAEPLATQIEAGSASHGGADSEPLYLEVPAATLTLQIRRADSRACRGALIGTIELPITGGTNSTLVLLGRSTRPRVDYELLLCADPPADSSCQVRALHMP